MKKSAILAFLLVLFASLLFQRVWAEGQDYVASVPVFSQSDAERVQGLRSALAQVVTQQSGDKGLAARLQIATLRDIYAYVQRYYYIQLHDEDSEDEEEDGALQESHHIESAPTQKLVVEFIPLRVDNLIQSADAATSTAPKTKVMLWLVVTEGDKVSLISDDETDKLTQQIKMMGKQKGLDIILPMLDLDDIDEISPQDVKAFSINPIKQASLRYHVDHIVAASALHQGGKWQMQWMLLNDGKRSVWNDRGITLEGAVFSGLLKAEDKIITPNEIGIDINQVSHIILTISDLTSVSDYAAINTYLHKLDSIDEVKVLRVDSQKVMFDLSVNQGDMASLIQSLNKQPNLKFDSNPSKQELNYRWSTH